MMPTIRAGQKVAGDDGTLHRDLLRWFLDLVVEINHPVTGLKTADYTAKYRETVLCDPTAGAFAVTLPAAAGKRGVDVTVKNASASANAITITPQTGETIDGGATATITTGWEAVTVKSDNSNWLTV